jgi:hypothetical protein
MKASKMNRYRDKPGEPPTVPPPYSTPPVLAKLLEAKKPGPESRRRFSKKVGHDVLRLDRKHGIRAGRHKTDDRSAAC